MYIQNLFSVLPADSNRRFCAWRASDDPKRVKEPWSSIAKRADSRDPATWITLEKAATLAGYLERQWAMEPRSYPYSGGIGVFLGPVEGGDVLCGADLDSCIDADTGGMAEWARRAIEAVPDGYWEMSPSGSGVKLLALIAASDVGRIRDALGLPASQDGLTWKRATGKPHAPGIEIYTGRRYFTVTGDSLARETIDRLTAEQAAALRSIGEELKRSGSWPGSGKTPARTSTGHFPSFEPASSGAGGQDGTWMDAGALSSDERMTGAGAERLRRLWASDISLIEGDRTGSGIAFNLAREMALAGFTDDEICSGLGSHPLTVEWTSTKGAANGWRELRRLLTNARVGVVSFDTLPIVEGLSSKDPSPKKPRKAAAAAKAPEAPPRELDEAALSGGADWREWLQRTDKAVLPNLYNGRLALTWAPEWRGALALNEFTDRIMLTRRPPFLGETSGEGGDRGERWTGERPVRDNDRIPVAGWLQAQGIQITPRGVWDAILGVALNNRVNPVRDYLERCEHAWDGIRRLDNWLTVHVGADDTPYIRAVASMTMIAAVARVMVPGCKVDTMGVLEGNQGIFKSSALRALFGDEYFLDNMEDLTSKDSKIGLGGKWGVEIAEMDKFSKAEISRVKVFLSTQFDHYRRPYGILSEDIARTCVIWGTINPGEEGYLTDETGNRRFWPIRCADRRIDIDAIRRDRDQLWAEATVRWRAGEHWWMDAHTSFQHEQVVWSRVERDSWHASVETYIARRAEITITELLRATVGKPMGNWNRGDQMRMARVLKMLGWVRVQVADLETGGRKWIYARKNGIVIPFPAVKKDGSED